MDKLSNTSGLFMYISLGPQSCIMALENKRRIQIFKICLPHGCLTSE